MQLRWPVCQCKIPVFKGSAKPVLGKGISAGHFHGMDGLGDAPDPNAPGLDLIQKESAVSAMIRIVDENPGEVRLYCPCGETCLVHYTLNPVTQYYT